MVQVLTTVCVGAFMMYNVDAHNWVKDHVWTFYVAMFGTIAVAIALGFKRRSYPTNFVLLGVFTLLESYTVGAIVSFVDKDLVVQALLLTLGVFFGLTLFTFQTRIDFSGLGPILYSGLWLLLLVFFMQIIFPFNRWLDFGIALATAVLFCGFIMYDTYQIIHRLSPEEYVIASLDLYLDIVNLFISILRILNDLNQE